MARALAENGLEAILIGNAAAALQGAPVATIDFDFLIRKTPSNQQKPKAVAKALNEVLYRPAYPVSGMSRISRDEDGLRVDFMTALDDVLSFASLRAKSHCEDLGGYSMLLETVEVAGLSKRPTGKKEPSMKRERAPSRKQVLAVLRAESDRALIEMIRRLLDKPLNERPQFLRKRVSYHGSCL